MIRLDTPFWALLPPESGWETHEDNHDPFPLVRRLPTREDDRALAFELALVAAGYDRV